MHEKLKTTHTKMGRFFFSFFPSFSFSFLLFLPLSLRGASSLVYIAASGAPDPGRKACTEPPTPTPDCEYCTNPTLETDTHTRDAATGVGQRTRTHAHTAVHGRGWGRPAVRRRCARDLVPFKVPVCSCRQSGELVYYQILIKDAFQEHLPRPAFFHRPTQVHEDLSSGGRVEGKGWAG